MKCHLSEEENNEKVASSKNCTQFQIRVHIPYFRPKLLKNHALWGRTYLYGLYNVVPPPPQPPGGLFSPQSSLVPGRPWRVIDCDVGSVCSAWPIHTLCIMATESEKDLAQKKQDKQRNDQNTVRLNIVWAFVAMSCYVIAAIYFPFPKLHLPTVMDRVVFTLRWLMVSLGAIYAGIYAVGRMRFATAAINPLDPSGKRFTQVPDRYLQNTVEQFLLHAFSLLALSTYLSEKKMHWIPLLVVLFVIARATFFVGYSIHPLKRAVGFAMTYFPTVGITGYCLYCMCVYGVQAPHWIELNRRSESGHII